MRLPIRRGSAILAAPVAVTMMIASAPTWGGQILVCGKDSPPPEEARLVASKFFEDEVAEVTALELAASRGRSRGGRTALKLLALRVQFQPDSDHRSTGDGTFDYSPLVPDTFDTPPHDREYFELHMTACANYFASVSYGNMTIEFDVAPADSRGAYVLPHDMGYYHDYSEEQVWYVSQVEEFTRDAFAAADTTDTLDFSQYDGYVLFHAGADWQSDVNLDTPFDLPSAHIALGEPILVDEGQSEVWGAAIMPETSNQDGLTILLNGTLVHEVAHIIGLPDLYNTSNFFPGIGYWGIMDAGGRIGMDTPWGWAYGVLPASPCAWSKEYLGWLDPVVLLSETTDIEVKATELRGSGFRLFKLPVTSTEYFLVENRLDDLPDSGPPDTLALVGIDVEQGVVLGPVDPFIEPPELNHEYDFLLPGPGLVVYHVDDTRVLPGLMPYDTVNAEWGRKGVAVEEADGIWDIGNIQSFYWNGNAYDPFYATTPSGAAHNDSFSYDTHPSTDTNLGAKTYLEVWGISDPGTEMTMNVRFDRWKEGWPVDTGEPVGDMSPRVGDLDGDGDGEVVVATRSGDVYAWHHDGTPVVPLCGLFGLFASVPGGMSYSPAVADIDHDGDHEVVVASDGGSLYVWNHTDVDANGAADLYSQEYPVAIDGPASAAPLAADLDGAFGLEIAAASSGGQLTIVDRSGAHVGASPYSFGHLVLEDVTMAAGNLDGDAALELVLTTTNRGWVAAVNADGTSVPGWPAVVETWERETVGVVVGDIDRAPDGAPEVVAVGAGGEVHVWDRRGNELTGWPVDLGQEVLARPSLGDLDGDGYLEVVVPAGPGTVWGLRWNGTRAENWPREMDPGDSTRAAGSSPLIGDVDADGTLDVLAAASGGDLYVWNALTGEATAGWPYSSDPSLGTPWLGDIDVDGRLDLLVAGTPGRVVMLALPYEAIPGGIIWSTESGSASGAGSYPDSLLPEAPDESPGLLVHDRTYCYPNPAKRADLKVRVYLEETADVVVEILDVSGQIVKRFEERGVPTVNEMIWETKDVASGLYIVHVEVTDPLAGLMVPSDRDTRVESKVMKVAVIR